LPPEYQKREITNLEGIGGTLDIHSAFTYERYMRTGIDAHFDARAFLTRPPLGPGGNISVKPSDFWKQTMEDTDIFTNDGTLTSPATHEGRGVRGIAIYGKKCFAYPHADFYTILPTLVEDGQNLWMGFEMGGGVGTGITAFLFLRTGGANVLRAAIGGRTNQFVYIDITTALPADHLTVAHDYSVRLTKSHAEFYIDDDLVAIGINSSNLAFPNINYPPYAIFTAPLPFASKNVLLVEVTGHDVELVTQLSPLRVRVGPDSPLPPRVYRLYEADTSDLFAGLTVGAGTLTSHPFPIFGYAGKTIYFKADQNSTANGLVIEVLTQAGNWIEYDSVTYAANDDWYYTIAGEAVLVRLVYTPAAYPAVINEGEAVMR